MEPAVRTTRIPEEGLLLPINAERRSSRTSSERPESLKRGCYVAKFHYRGMQLTLVRFVCALDGRPEGAERE